MGGDMIKLFSAWLALTATLVTSGALASGVASSTANMAEIRQVTTHFQTALQKKDGPALRSLLF
jgi:hypothetical protein